MERGDCADNFDMLNLWHACLAAFYVYTLSSSGHKLALFFRRGGEAFHARPKLITNDRAYHGQTRGKKCFMPSHSKISNTRAADETVPNVFP